MESAVQADKPGEARWQARYTGPDGRTYSAPVTFESKADAEGWLSLRQSEILRGAWLPPVNPTAPIGAVDEPLTLETYSRAWLAGRDLSEGSRLLYSLTLKNQVLPDLGRRPVNTISPAVVRAWHSGLMTGPTQKSHAYSLLRTILYTAVDDGLIASNPCRVRGAGSVKRVVNIRPATLPELEIIATEVPEQYRLMILLAAWCALRFGEVTELRRSDIDVKNALIRVRRGVVRGANGQSVKDPKSQAGKRDVNIPPHLMPVVKQHLAEHITASRDALLFPGEKGGHLASSSLYEFYYPAREKAGRPDLRFHDLRHTGAVLAAATGATLAELMARLGHSTVSAALRYQHAAADRDKVIAEALSRLAGEPTVTAISQAGSR